MRRAYEDEDAWSTNVASGTADADNVSVRRVRACNTVCSRVVAAVRGNDAAAKSCQRRHQFTNWPTSGRPT
jgi:hypothetical protein